jgi:hypothetical protein
MMSRRIRKRGSFVKYLQTEQLLNAPVRRAYTDNNINIATSGS